MKRTVMPKSPYIVGEGQALRNFRKSGTSMMSKKQKKLMMEAHSKLTKKARRKKRK